MNKIYLDFETRSEVDLMNTNASIYAQHPSTKILCGVFKKGNEYLRILNFDKQEIKEKITTFIGDGVLVAHNAQFEILMWKHNLVQRLGYPEYELNRWRCTMAKAAAHALPRSLEKCADVLHLLQVKDMSGKNFMLKMCKPNGANDIESFKRLVSYCQQDVVVTELIDKLLPDLSEYEQKVWELDQEINFRGVQIDVSLVDNIIVLLNSEKEMLLKEFKELTNGEIETPDRRAAFQDWLSRFGLDLPDMQAKTVAAIQTSNPTISRTLRIRSILSKKSTAKYQTIKNTTEQDGRLRCNLIYHGASTGRWTGSGAQLQNLPRPKIDPDIALEMM